MEAALCDLTEGRTQGGGQGSELEAGIECDGCTTLSTLASAVGRSPPVAAGVVAAGIVTKLGSDDGGDDHLPGALGKRLCTELCVCALANINSCISSKLLRA